MISTTYKIYDRKLTEIDHWVLINDANLDQLNPNPSKNVAATVS